MQNPWLSWQWPSVVGQHRQRLEDWLFSDLHGTLAAAACRIGTGLSVLGLLLSNFSTRGMWVGPGSVWAEPARAVSQFPELVLLRNVSGDVVVVVYVLTMIAALAFLLGWHTKAANAATLIGFIAIVGQNPVVSGQGDNLVRLTLLWLLLVRSAEHWSLDARRRDRTAASEAAASRRSWSGDDVLPPWLTTSMHNIGLVGLGVQTVLIYLTAGLDKVSQQAWQHGTALYYTLQLPEYRTFPWLADLLSRNSVLLALATYTVLLTQLFFAPLLLNATARKVVVLLAVAVNVVFGVVFATPWSSLAIIAVTCLFASQASLEALEVRIRRLVEPGADWLAMRSYDVLDLLDAARHKFIFPVFDWVRFSVLRR